MRRACLREVKRSACARSHLIFWLLYKLVSAFKPKCTLMSKKESILLVHPNGNHRIVKMGFCWGGFFVPALWAISEGLWRPFAFSALLVKLTIVSGDAATEFERRSLPDTASLLNIATALCVVAYILTMLLYGLFGKKWLVGKLKKQGYVEHG